MSNEMKIDHDLWALHAAAEGALPYLKLALKLGAKINGTKNNFGRVKTTPLAEASAHDQMEAAKYLLADGANPDLLLEGGFSPGAHARPEMAKTLYPGNDKKRRAAFALACRSKAICNADRDVVAEAQSWIDEGTNPLEPIFDGLSLAFLLASVDRCKYLMGMGIEQFIKKLLADAKNEAELAEAFAVSVAAGISGIGPELARQGALKNATPQSLNDMLDACMNGYSMMETGLALLEAGADPCRFVFKVVKRNGHVEELAKAVKMQPAQCARCADSDGHGLLHRVVERLMKEANDPDEFDLLHRIAIDLANDPSARTLTGNGLGKSGPPTVSFAPFLSDAANFKNQKRVKKAAALAKILIEKALLEVAEFDSEGECAAAPLPGSMNVLHLALIAKQKEVESTLLEVAAKLGKNRLVELAGKKALIAAPGSEEKIKELSPLDCILSLVKDQMDFGLALEFAKAVGPNSKIGGVSMFSVLCMSYPLNPGNSDLLAEQIGMLFDLGADPESKTADGKRLLAALLAQMNELVDKENKYWKKISLDDQQRAEATITEAFMSARLNAPKKSSGGKRTGVNDGL
jgi:hypothetical protein